MTTNIDIINSSATKEDLAKIAHAVQQQIREDFAQYWPGGSSATVTVRDKVLPGHWALHVLDNSDEPGALGYHETDPADPTKPVGKVFQATDAKYGLALSVTLSHEVLEMVGDPWADLTIQVGTTNFWALESCDAVEADADGYQKDGVQVSNFVTPAWFRGGSGKLDFVGQVKQPRTLRPGGYQAIWNGRTWTQSTAQAAPGVNSRALAHAGLGRTAYRRDLQAWAEALQLAR